MIEFKIINIDILNKKLSPIIAYIRINCFCFIKYKKILTNIYKDAVNIKFKYIKLDKSNKCIYKIFSCSNDKI